jgi:hypothetical protein
MKIVSDDQKGLGQEKGAFAYVTFGRNEVRLVDGDNYKPSCLSECILADATTGGVDFNNYSRNHLDEDTHYTVGILTKEELGEMIKSLQNIYGKME